MDKVKRFFSWLFRSPYVSNMPYSYDNGDYLNCDKTPTEYVTEEERIPDILEQAEEQDKEFYKLIDPKGCRIEIYKDKKKEWRWRYVAANNKVIAVSSEGYKTRASMRKSLDLVREVIPFAPVEEE